MTEAEPSGELPLHRRTFANLIAAQAERHGDRSFLLFEDRRFSYADAHLVSNRVANGLAAAGVGHGDHVAFFLDNKPEVLWLHFACAKIGAVPVPINTAAKGELLAYYLTNSDSVAIVLDAAVAGRFLAVEATCPKLRLAVIVGDGSPGENLTRELRTPAIDYRELEQAADTTPDSPARFSDIAHIFYTSGTTGPSKGCMVAHATALGISQKYVRNFGYRSDDILYTCLPLFHGNAFNCTMLPALLAGAAVALSRRFSASRFWDEIRAFRATQFTLLSAMINIIWNRPESPLDHEHHARLCQVIPTPDCFHDFERRFKVKFVSLYSLSDYGLGAMLGPDHPPDKWRSAGKIMPDVAVAILDDDDLALPVGEVGEICMRSNEPWNCRQGYYGMPEAFLAACRNFWFHTGDRGYLDADGYLYFIDRKKDVIRRRGENISAYELEQIVQRHPAVAEVAAFPVRSAMSEDEVMVSVVRSPEAPLTAETLVDYCAANMAYFMVPRYVEFIDALPKTMTQKVEKFKLRQSAEQRLDHIWDRERLGIVVSRS
jgi:crotonobetaine/carnitine-CoA ligase